LEEGGTSLNGLHGREARRGVYFTGERGNRENSSGKLFWSSKAEADFDGRDLMKKERKTLTSGGGSVLDTREEYGGGGGPEIRTLRKEHSEKAVRGASSQTTSEMGKKKKVSCSVTITKVGRYEPFFWTEPEQVRSKFPCLPGGGGLTNHSTREFFFSNADLPRSIEKRIRSAENISFLRRGGGTPPI